MGGVVVIWGGAFFSYLKIRETEFNLSIETARAEEGGIKGIGSVGGHENLDVTSRLKPIELVDDLCREQQEELNARIHLVDTRR